jgi:hypothetical protein
MTLHMRKIDQKGGILDHPRDIPILDPLEGAVVSIKIALFYSCSRIDRAT